MIHETSAFNVVCMEFRKTFAWFHEIYKGIWHIRFNVGSVAGNKGIAPAV